MRGYPDDRLAQRYRRLLWAYPSDYRHERGDEIVGVLLDAARPDQARPSLLDVGDLVRAGLIARAGATRVGYLSSPWRDAMAVIGVMLPLVLAARGVLWARQIIFAVGSGYFHLAQWDGPDFRYGAVSAVLWLVVALAVVTRRLRAAVVCATVATTVQAVLVMRLAIIDSASSAFGLVAVLVVEVVASVLLARRPDVERGVDLVGRRALTAALVGFVLVKAGHDGWSFGSLGVVARWFCGSTVGAGGGLVRTPPAS